MYIFQKHSAMTAKLKKILAFPSAISFNFFPFLSLLLPSPLSLRSARCAVLCAIGMGCKKSTEIFPRQENKVQKKRNVINWMKKKEGREQAKKNGKNALES